VTLGAEQGAQHRVDQPGRHRIVAALLAAQFAGRADRRDQREEQTVEMGQVARLQPRLAEHRAESRRRVAPLMMVGDIMRAPHPGSARHGDQDAAARGQLVLQAGERLDIAGDVLEHIEQHDQIIGPVVERHMGQIATLDRQPAALLREGASAVVGLDRIDRTVAPEQLEIRSGPRPDLEDAHRPRPGPVAVDQGGDDPAPGDEPPMVLVDLRHAVIGGAIHQSPSFVSGSAPPIRAPSRSGSAQPIRWRTM